MERSREIEGFAERLYELMRAGDGAGAAALLADGDLVFVGTDPDEWWDTSEAAKAAFREQLEATGGFDIHSSRLVGFADGDVGWLADQPMMRIGGQEVPMRMTGVVHRGADGWRMVQGHLSVAAQVNDDLFE
jgi:hypothetical protein